MNSVGSSFHWVSRTSRIHVLRLQADMWSKVFVPLTSVARFPLIWIRLKLHPSFANCCLPKSTSDLLILLVLCVTINNEGSAVHAVSAVTFSRSDQDRSKRGMRDPSNGRVLCTVSVWYVVNSPLALTADGSVCLLCTHSVLTKGAVWRAVSVGLPWHGRLLSSLTSVPGCGCAANTTAKTVSDFCCHVSPFLIKGQSNRCEKI